MAVPIIAGQDVVEALAEPRAGVLRHVVSSLASNRKAVTGAALLGVFTMVALFAPLIAPYDPHALLFDPILHPSAQHLLGTTQNGQDTFSQLVWSTRESLALAVIAGVMATTVSVLVGVTAAYLGGLWDHVLNLFTDVFLVIPTLPLMTKPSDIAKPVRFGRIALRPAYMSMIRTGDSPFARAILT